MTKDYNKMSEEELLDELQHLNKLITVYQGILGHYAGLYKSALASYNIAVSVKLDEKGDDNGETLPTE